MLNDLIKIRNQHQPHSKNNNDALQYDYHFWTEVEKTGRAKRAKSLDVLKSACKSPDTPGVIIRGSLYETSLEQTAPYRKFSKELFIELILEAFPEVPKHKLRELATEAVVDDSPRKTYKVRGVEKKDD